MDSGLLTLAFVGLGMMVVQNIFTYFQYKQVQKQMKKLHRTGRVVGVGLRKGGFNPSGGSILILAWNKEKDVIEECVRLQGIAFWNRFVNIDDYNGMSLLEVRKQGIVEDGEINKTLRKTQPYTPNDADKRRKKGVLIQAVEAIEKYVKNHSSAKTLGEEKTVLIDREKIRKRQLEIRNKK